jgi:two-component system sensor histidine kinase/response regulator
MGGRLWVESEEGRCSTFHFELPLGIGASPRRAGTPAPVGLAGMPVLVVDDNETNRRVITATLKQWQMRPLAVESGAAAMAALESARHNGGVFPLVLLDAHMPQMDGFEVVRQMSSRLGRARATILMLSSDDRAGDAARCRQLGVATYLIKPLTRNELLASIVTALAGAPEPIPALSSEVPTASSLAGGLRLLLAEDNIVNQKLAAGLLERDGHSVLVVGDGQAAVDATTAERFDAILMDVQMPEMGGFEATAAIRTREQRSGVRTRIIAMTAHAMQGDRERCIAADMDDYISKPIKLSDLRRVLGVELPERDGEEVRS